MEEMLCSVGFYKEEEFLVLKECMEGVNMCIMDLMNNDFVKDYLWYLVLFLFFVLIFCV